MRIDKFLNSVNITKRRSIAQDMLVNGVIFINDKQAKASKHVEVGDVIKIAYLQSQKLYEILALPTTKSTPKSQQAEYIKELN
ncbi:MAG: RNA-binding S4 domain-containing protein [Helicobacteraceae bacterium]|nr:RNA-binding S4 domain-containing protein [Helicobacteraceae bacterium]